MWETEFIYSGQPSHLIRFFSFQILMASIESTLQNTSVDAIVPKGQKLIVIDSKDSIKNALKVSELNKHLWLKKDSSHQQYLQCSVVRRCSEAILWIYWFSWSCDIHYYDRWKNNNSIRYFAFLEMKWIFRNEFRQTSSCR